MTDEEEKTQFLLKRALTGEKLTSKEAGHVARVAQENTDFRLRIQEVEGSIQKMIGNLKRIVYGALALMLTNFLNDFFG